MTTIRPLRIALLGAGRLAGDLGPALVAAGHELVAVSARRKSALRRLARRLPGALATTIPARAAARSEVLLLAVPDRAVEELAETLACADDFEWSGRVVLHHAGVLGPEPLASLRDRGAETGVLHPLQVFTGRGEASRTTEGTRARIEGSPAAQDVARRLARSLGWVPLTRPARWTPRSRELYHAAASIAANDLLALLSHSTETLRAAGVPESEALTALLPLVHGTVDEIERAGLVGALTGPASRGDRETLERHDARLERLSPEAAELHRLLSRRLAVLAARRRR